MHFFLIPFAHFTMTVYNERELERRLKTSATIRQRLFGLRRFGKDVPIYDGSAKTFEDVRDCSATTFRSTTVRQRRFEPRRTTGPAENVLIFFGGLGLYSFFPLLSLYPAVLCFSTANDSTIE